MPSACGGCGYIGLVIVTTGQLVRRKWTEQSQSGSRNERHKQKKKINKNYNITNLTTTITTITNPTKIEAGRCMGQDSSSPIRSRSDSDSASDSGCTNFGALACALHPPSLDGWLDVEAVRFSVPSSRPAKAELLGGMDCHWSAF